MKNLFVPKDIAKAVFAKGFKEQCIAWYGTREFSMGLLCWNTYNGNPIEIGINDVKPIQCDTYAPLYQQVVDWFEMYGIFIAIRMNSSKKYSYSINILDDKGWKNIITEYIYGNKYEALDKAITRALTLIPNEEEN